MAAAEVDSHPAEPAPAVPDYLASPNAVFEDKDAQWRYGHPPDYSKTRAVWEQTKTMNHAAGSLPQLVENLVKNWEVEASFKPRLEDWRTIDHANYTFAINGGPPQTAEHMLKVGTYNAIVAPNEYYSPEHSDFATSHKTFKRMMPTFAWEVLEVYSGPPKVAFRWRHWGEMKSDYVGFNNKGEKITAKAHGGKIDIEGVTVAEVDDKVRLRKVETWFDPMEMFRQIAPQGIVNKEIVSSKVEQEEPPKDIPVNDGIQIAQDHNASDASHSADMAPEVAIPKEISPSTGLPADKFVPHQGTSTLSEQKEDAGVTQPDSDAHKHEITVPSVTDTSQVDTTSQPPQPESLSASHKHEAMTQEPDASVQPSAVQPDAAVHQTQTESRTPSDSGAISDSSDKTWEKVDRPDEVSSATTSSGLLKQLDNFVQNVGTGISNLPAALQSKEGEAGPPSSMEHAVKPDAGQAVVASAQSEETRMTHEEMSKITPMECPFLMNRE